MKPTSPDPSKSPTSILVIVQLWVTEEPSALVTVTDTNGETLAWDSAGTIGFKGARKSTPFAATRAGEQVGQKVRKMGMSEVEVKVKGTGAGRESAVSGVASTGIRVTAVEDHTPVPHNGCRPRKKRRV